jgi:hypothetical protein
MVAANSTVQDATESRLPGTAAKEKVAVRVKAQVGAKVAAEVKVVARIEQVKSPPRFLKPRRVALEAKIGCANREPLLQD